MVGPQDMQLLGGATPLLPVAVVIALISAVALLLGFTDFAVAAAMGSLALFCLVIVSSVATMLMVVGSALAGRARYCFRSWS